jgi:hypothetical protein
LKSRRKEKKKPKYEIYNIVGRHNINHEDESKILNGQMPSHKIKAKMCNFHCKTR